MIAIIIDGYQFSADPLAVLSEAPTLPMSSASHIPEIDMKPLLGMPSMDLLQQLKPDSPPTNGTRNNSGGIQMGLPNMGMNQSMKREIVDDPSHCELQTHLCL